MTIFVPDASNHSIEAALYHLFMDGDRAPLDTIMGKIPDTHDIEDMNIQSDTDDSGDGEEESYDDSDITEEEEECEIIETDEEVGARDTDMQRLWEAARNKISYPDESGLEWEHNGVNVDETVDVDNKHDREYYGGLTPGGPVTSTEVRRNHIRPASIMGISPSFLLTSSPRTEAMTAWREHGDTADIMGEEDDTKESLAWEDDGVMVDESQSYIDFGDGSFLTSTGVKRNPIRPPTSSSLGSSFTSSPVTEARWMRRVIGENQVRASSLNMYLWHRSLWHFATSLCLLNGLLIFRTVHTTMLRAMINFSRTRNPWKRVFAECLSVLQREHHCHHSHSIPIPGFLIKSSRKPRQLLWTS